jgi:pyruvate/2-oxoglutarate dehydrogenase complex dihydrolipoamide acyltransferase (E2) component
MTEPEPSFTTIPFAPARSLYADTLSLGHRKHTVHGLIEVDVTRPRSIIRAHRAASGERVSFTAFLTACLGRAVASNREMHAYRDWRRRLVLFDDVDISTMIEMEVEGKRLPLAHVIRGANRRTVRSIHDEIRQLQARTRHGPPHRLWPYLRLYPWIPGFLRRLVWRFVFASPHRIKKNVGTVGLTAVGMFGRGVGWAVTWPVYTLGLAIGGIAQRPVLGEDGGLENREYLSITLSVDHDVVDGAPIARFAQNLSELIESARGLEFLAEGRTHDPA